MPTIDELLGIKRTNEVAGSTGAIFDELQQIRKAIGLPRPEGTEVAKQIQTNLLEPEKSPGFQLAQNLLTERATVRKRNLNDILQKAGLGGTVSGPGLEKLVSGERQTDIDLGNLALGTSEKARGEALDLTRISEGVFGLESGRARRGTEIEQTLDAALERLNVGIEGRRKIQKELLDSNFFQSLGNLGANAIPAILDFLFGKGTSSGSAGGILNNLFRSATKLPNPFGDDDDLFDFENNAFTSGQIDQEDQDFFGSALGQGLLGAGAAGVGFSFDQLFGGGEEGEELEFDDIGDDLFGDFLNFSNAPGSTAGAGAEETLGLPSTDAGDFSLDPSLPFSILGAGFTGGGEALGALTGIAGLSPFLSIAGPLAGIAVGFANLIFGGDKTTSRERRTDAFNVAKAEIDRLGIRISQGELDLVLDAIIGSGGDFNDKIPTLSTEALILATFSLQAKGGGALGSFKGGIQAIGQELLNRGQKDLLFKLIPDFQRKSQEVIDFGQGQFTLPLFDPETEADKTRLLESELRFLQEQQTLRVSDPLSEDADVGIDPRAFAGNRRRIGELAQAGITSTSSGLSLTDTLRTIFTDPAEFSALAKRLGI